MATRLPRPTSAQLPVELQFDAGACACPPETIARSPGNGGRTSQGLVAGVGVGIPLITRRVFDFTGVNPGSEIEVVMVKQIQVDPVAQADLLLRIHDTDMTGNDTINVRAFRYSQDPGDPGEDFVETPAFGTLSFAGTPPNNLLVQRLTPPYGEMLRFTVGGARAAVEVAQVANFTAELSLELIPRASN